jgi:nucleotide-binding universal stress UspA family protein
MLASSLGIRGAEIVAGVVAVAGLLLGSVSQGAAATASCPVVLVKATDEPR